MSFISSSAPWLIHLWITQHSHLQRLILVLVYFSPGSARGRQARVLKVNAQSQASNRATRCQVPRMRTDSLRRNKRFLPCPAVLCGAARGWASASILCPHPLYILMTLCHRDWLSSAEGAPARDAQTRSFPSRSGHMRLTCMLLGHHGFTSRGLSGPTAKGEPAFVGSVFWMIPERVSGWHPWPKADCRFGRKMTWRWLLRSLTNE